MNWIPTDTIAHPSLRFRSACLAVGLTIAGLAVPAASVTAQTLPEALANAYTGNPDMQAARARLRVANESVALTRSAWRPTVKSNLSLGANAFENRRNGTSTDDVLFPAAASISVTQPIYQGDRAEAAVQRTLYDVQAERARMYATEQQVLLQAATVYVNTIRDASVLDLRNNNLVRLQKQLEATQERFAVGEVTRTDVAQAESRVARAEADRTLAAGNLVTTRVGFERLTGMVPGALTLPPARDDLPASRDEAIEIALENSFALIGARFEELSDRQRIVEIDSEQDPHISMIGAASYGQDSNYSEGSSTAVSVEVRVDIPIYQAGTTAARIRSASETANLRRILIESNRRNAVETAASAFEAWTTAVARTQSLATEVVSARVALEGVEQEAAVGSRTVLDVLDAEQAVLDAQVGLVSAESDTRVASYRLLASIGRLTAGALNLPVELYDPDRHFLATESRSGGTELLSD